VVFTGDQKAVLRLTKCGIEVLAAKRDANGRVDIPAMLQALGKRGVTRLLVEGGRTVQSSFLHAGLADRVELFTAPVFLGAQQGNAARTSVNTDLKALPFARESRRMLGPDLLESFVRKA